MWYTARMDSRVTSLLPAAWEATPPEAEALVVARQPNGMSGARVREEVSMSTEKASVLSSAADYDGGQPIQRAARGVLEKLPPELAFNDYPTENTGLFVAQDYPLLEEAHRLPGGAMGKVTLSASRRS